MSNKLLRDIILCKIIALSLGSKDKFYKNCLLLAATFINHPTIAITPSQLQRINEIINE